MMVFLGISMGMANLARAEFYCNDPAWIEYRSQEAGLPELLRISQECPDCSQCFLIHMALAQKYSARGETDMMKASLKKSWEVVYYSGSKWDRIEVANKIGEFHEAGGDFWLAYLWHDKALSRGPYSVAEQEALIKKLGYLFDQLKDLVNEAESSCQLISLPSEDDIQCLGYIDQMKTLLEEAQAHNQRIQEGRCQGY